jgi:hypothetical protein
MNGLRPLPNSRVIGALCRRVTTSDAPEQRQGGNGSQNVHRFPLIGIFPNVREKAKFFNYYDCGAEGRDQVPADRIARLLASGDN